MRLARIEGAGVRSLVDPFAVDLPARGLVLVKGTSGAGKSTLLSVPGFVLGYGPPATRFQSWHAKKCEGTLTLVEGDRRVLVTRAGKLRVSVDGVETEGNAAAQEAAFKAELGVPLEILDKLAWRRQRRGSAFLDMPDDRKKAFLAGPAGLEDLECKVDTGKARVSAAERTLEAAEANHTHAQLALTAVGPALDVAALEAALQRTGDALAAARDSLVAARLLLSERTGAVREAGRQQIEEAKTTLQAARDRLHAVRPPVVTSAQLVTVCDVLTQQLRTCRAAMAEQEAAARVRRGDWEAQRRVAEQAAMAGHAAQQQLPGLAQQIEALDHEIAHLTGQTCPTCRRAWPEAAGEGLAPAVARREALVARHVRAAIEAQQVGALSRWDAAHVWTPDDPSLLHRAEQVLLERLGGARAAVTAAEEADRREAQQARRDDQREHDAAERALIQLEEAQHVHPDLVRLGTDVQQALADERVCADAANQAQRDLRQGQDALARWAKLEQRAADADALLERCRQEHAEAADTHEAVRAFVARWFDQMLLEVADQTNRILAQVPNVQHCAISFRSEVVSRKGEVTRQAIVPVLSVAGHELVGDLDGASGGMLSSIELAVDLGVLQVQERRLGRKVGWLVIDEAFEGLPQDSREACFEVLRAEAQHRLVLVVDHASDVGGLADHVVNITYQDGRATVGPCA